MLPADPSAEARATSPDPHASSCQLRLRVQEPTEPPTEPPQDIPLESLLTLPGGVVEADNTRPSRAGGWAERAMEMTAGAAAATRDAAKRGRGAKAAGSVAPPAEAAGSAPPPAKAGTGDAGKRGQGVKTKAKAAGSAPPPAKASQRNLKAVTALIAQQRKALPDIQDELNKHNCKRGHWIWWVFPNDRPGAADPIASFVSLDTAPVLFGGETADLWQQVLEKCCDLIEARGKEAIPRIDHGRIYFFIDFWKGVPDKPPWLDEVLERLSRHRWPKS